MAIGSVSPFALYQRDASGNVTGLRGPDGETVSLGPRIFAQSGIPMILPSSGSIGDNGALTLTTALFTTFSGGCYMYFPANAISAGSAAGIYYVVMSSTTVGTIYNNTYTGGTPEIPASPTPFVTTGPGAYTQTTSTQITILSLPLPANTISAEHPYAEFIDVTATNASVNARYAYFKINDNSVSQLYKGGASNAFQRDNYPIVRRSDTTYIRPNFVSGYVAANAAVLEQTCGDLTQDGTIAMTLQIQADTDYVALCYFALEVL